MNLTEKEREGETAITNPPKTIIRNDVDEIQGNSRLHGTPLAMSGRYCFFSLDRWFLNQTAMVSCEMLRVSASSVLLLLVRYGVRLNTALMWEHCESEKMVRGFFGGSLAVEDDEDEEEEHVRGDDDDADEAGGGTSAGKWQEEAAVVVEESGEISSSSCNSRTTACDLCHHHRLNKVFTERI